jgi:hypothetical protein
LTMNPLHDDAPARLVAAAAVARLAALDGLGLDDGNDGGGGAAGHLEDCGGVGLLQGQDGSYIVKPTVDIPRDWLV